MLDEVFREHGEKNLAPKTLERYREEVAYLQADLLKMPVADIRPLHFSREWNRLLTSGGHHRKTKAPRPLSKKTVRNIAGAVSSAYSRAVRWGIVASNPIELSDPPTPEKRTGAALTPTQQELLLNAAASTWGYGHVSRILRRDRCAPGRGPGVTLVRYKGRRSAGFPLALPDAGRCRF
jgi:site-specific recombinase XerD